MVYDRGPSISNLRGSLFTEIRLGNQYLVQFFAGDEMPQGLIAMVYLILFRGEQVLVGGTEAGNWDMVRGEVTQGETVEAAMGRLAEEQVGAQLARRWLVGTLHCRALSGAPVGKPGETVYRPVYIGEAGQVLEHPTAPGWMRRFVSLRDLLQLIRSHHYELADPLLYAADQSLRLRSASSSP